jgi:hypothetical protein
MKLPFLDIGGFGYQRRRDKGKNGNNNFYV